MAANVEFVRYIEELLAPLDTLTTGPFFGGRALKYHGQQFAWIIGSTLYLRVGDTTRPDFEAEGAQPFKYTTKKGEVTVRKFYTAPEFLLDDPEQLLHWSRRAIDAAAD
jgi:DNA transformation protein